MRQLIAPVLIALVALAPLTACGDGGETEADTGPRARAVEQLVAFGLDDDEAECIVDEVGADAVVEATDLNAYTESEQYRSAADGCTDG